MDYTQPGQPERFDASHHRLYRRLLGSDGRIDHRAWVHAAAVGEHVGTCRNCGSYLVADPPVTVRAITWYTAVCVNRPCGHIVAAPNGEIVRRSSRTSERPPTYRNTDTGGRSWPTS